MSEEQYENDQTEEKNLKLDAVQEAVNVLFQAWVLSLCQPLFYAMSHAFNHYMEEGVYADDLIARELEKLYEKDFVKFDANLEKFRVDLIKKISKRLDK